MGVEFIVENGEGPWRATTKAPPEKDLSREVAIARHKQPRQGSLEWDATSVMARTGCNPVFNLRLVDVAASARIGFARRFDGRKLPGRAYKADPAAELKARRSPKGIVRWLGNRITLPRQLADELMEIVIVLENE